MYLSAIDILLQNFTASINFGVFHLTKGEKNNSLHFQFELGIQ
jgi:hypothetical protein